MIFDGTNLICVIGEKNSGRRSLICSIINKFAFNPVFMDGNKWTLSPMKKSMEMLDDAELIQNSLASFDAIKIFDIENIVSDEREIIPDFADLALLINDELCGRIHFSNIRGNTKNYENLKKYAYSILLVVIECRAVLDNDSEYFDRLLFQLAKAVDVSPVKPRIVFALTKADILSEEMRSRDFEKFYELFEQNAKPLLSYCLKNALMFERKAVSAFNQDKSKIFGSNGEFLKEPCFEPWEVERLLFDMVYLAVPVIRERLKNVIYECNDTIRRRRGIFNRENIRAQLDLRLARQNLCIAIKNIYPLDNAAKYIE